MDELKVHIWLVMLRKIKNNKNATKTAKKISSVYGQGIITDHQFQICFLKFRSGDTSLRDQPRPKRSSDLGQDTLRELVEYNLRKSYMTSLHSNPQSAVAWKR